MQAQQLDAGLTPATFKESCGASSHAQDLQMRAGDCCHRGYDTDVGAHTACDQMQSEPDGKLSKVGGTDRADRPSNGTGKRIKAFHLPSAELRRQVGVRWPAEPFYVHISQ